MAILYIHFSDEFEFICCAYIRLSTHFDYLNVMQQDFGMEIEVFFVISREGLPLFEVILLDSCGQRPNSDERNWHSKQSHAQILLKRFPFRCFICLFKTR